MTQESAAAGALRAWRFRVALRRLVRGNRLLLLVLTVAVLASTAVTSVGLLITATEQSAIRTSLAAVSSAQTEMSVNIEQTKLGVGATEKRVDGAVGSLLESAATVTRTARAYTQPAPVKAPSGSRAFTYFGELGDVAKHVKILSGVLPTTTPGAGATTMPVAIPDNAAAKLHLHLGSTFAFSGGTRTITVKIVGIYRLLKPASIYWSQDELNGSGLDPNFQIVSDFEEVSATAFGPLLVAPGSMDVAGTTADRLELDYSPHFTKTDADQLSPLISRLLVAGSTIPSDLGGTANQLTFSGNAAVPLEQIASALVVTRSTVVVVTLLLLVLSIAALGQAARLFNESRAGDRDLMRARGASRGQLLGIAFLEAAVVGVLTAAVSAPLARLVYAIIAAQPAMVAAHVPSDSGLPVSAWLTSIALGGVFIVVLLLSLLGRSGSFVSAEQNKSRPRRVSGLLRSGLDLGVVALAIVAFWQLSIYRSPVGATASLSVDPVLAAAPALVLLAGALLAARLFPLLARLIDWFGSRSSGVQFRLASWEIGRRSGRATAVVLLLTLALAVGTFGETFLATWQQSQVDQATYAVGPTVRVPAVGTEGGAQRASLTRGATGVPQPVIRRVADVAQDGQDGEDTNAVVLGLTAGAREMLDRGPLASEGGGVLTTQLKGTATPVAGIRLPGDPSGIQAVVQIGNADQTLPGVSSDIHAVVQDGAGLLTTVNLGTIPVDGAPHTLVATLPALSKGQTRPLPLEFVGLQAGVFLGNQATYVKNPPLPTTLLLGQLASMEPASDGTFSTHPATGAATSSWGAGSADDFDSPAQRITVPGWQIALGVTIPGDVQTNPGNYSITAWPSVDRVPVVLSTALAHQLLVTVGTVLTLNLADGYVNVEVAAESALVPAAVDGSLLTASAAAGAASSNPDVVVIDQTALERALIQSGASGSMVDEWWVTVPPSTAGAYVAAHPSVQGSGPARSSVLLAAQMQQDPLRVATQAALWLAIAAAALLAAIGFAVHSASTLAARRIELAQLRAIGLSRRRLVGLIGAESLVLCVLGVLFGLAVGLGLGLLAGPLIALSPNGTPAVPGVRVVVPWLEIALLVVVVALVLIAVVGAVARGQRSANPANILREADNG
ncbi:MAG TPA: FtsX-like permease family protein [Galbitalea sp.]|nr:FtsX-like permease family protein [Galbitalea sp.]